MEERISSGLLFMIIESSRRVLIIADGFSDGGAAYFCYMILTLFYADGFFRIFFITVNGFAYIYHESIKSVRRAEIKDMMQVDCQIFSCADVNNPFRTVISA